MSFWLDLGINAINSPVAGDKSSIHSPESGSVNLPDI
jgi:hypothetical protein